MSKKVNSWFDEYSCRHVVAKSDFDAQRLCADTAEAERDNYIKQAVIDTAHRQALLAAAEQRIANMAEALKNLQNAAYNIGGEHVTGYQWLIDAADDAGAALYTTAALHNKNK